VYHLVVYCLHFVVIFSKYSFFLFSCNCQDIVAHTEVITEVQDLKLVGAVLNFKLLSNNGSYCPGPLHGTSMTQVLDSCKDSRCSP
jgi:hypothetical protein